MDKKGRLIPTVRIAPMSQHEEEEQARSTRTAEDQLLAAMLDHPDNSLAELGKACGWLTQKDEPQKSKLHRVMKRLEKDNLAKLFRDTWQLTDKGKTAAKTKQNDEIVKANARARFD